MCTVINFSFCCHLLLLLLVANFYDSAYISETSCPQVCQCLDKDVGCNNLNLTSLPTDIDVLTEKLELAENKLSAEKLSLKFQAYPNLKNLDLRDNFITVINQDLLHGLQSSLEYLDLSGNGINDVKKNTLSSLRNLKYLKLSRNDLYEIPELPANLLVLDLSENFKINSLKSNSSFRGLKKLRHLILNDCSIYTVDDSAFDEQEELIDLRMNGNSLYQVPSFLPPSLTTLSLQDNRLKSIGAPGDDVANPFERLTRLEQLFLQRNWISVIGDSVFKSIASLRELHLSVNRLIKIPSFLPKSLMILEIGGNQLTRIASDSGYISVENNPFLDLPDLAELGLSNNSLVNMPARLLQNNRKLSILDLSFNDFTQIPNIYSSSRLEINLDANSIREIDESSFKNCPNVKKIYLNNNKISRVDGTAIEKLKELKTLELRDNLLRDLPLFITRKLVNIDLSKNYIQTITPSTFNNSKTLSKINLETNDLSKIQESVFKYLTRLRYLFLANNNIIELDFKIPDSVTEFQIHHNQLATIGNLSSTFFTPKSYLTALDLSANNIRSISPQAFTNFKYLTDLYLDENRLSSLNLKLPSSAKRITVKNNLIRKLEAGSLTGLTYAYVLDLTNNSISLIEKGFFISDEFKARYQDGNVRPFELILDLNNIQTLSRGIFAPILDNKVQLLLYINDNDVRCNCLWQWLTKELTLPYMEIYGECNFPRALRNWQMSLVPNEKFQCSKPKIKTKSRNMKLITSVGATARLTCVAEGEPIPFYTWAIHSNSGNDLITLINDEVYVSIEIGSHRYLKIVLKI